MLPTSGSQQDEQDEIVEAPDIRSQVSHSQDRQEFQNKQIGTEELLGFQSKRAGKTR
jgi:hypothetical protein